MKQMQGRLSLIHNLVRKKRLSVHKLNGQAKQRTLFGKLHLHAVGNVVNAESLDKKKKKKKSRPTSV